MDEEQPPVSTPLDQQRPLLNASPMSKSSFNNLGSISIIGEVLIVKANDSQGAAGDTSENQKKASSKLIDLSALVNNTTDNRLL